MLLGTTLPVMIPDRCWMEMHAKNAVAMVNMLPNPTVTVMIAMFACMHEPTA